MTTHRTRSKLSQAKSETKPEPCRWSHHVIKTSNALNIEPDILKSRSPMRITVSLEASAEHSRQRKGAAFQSAMSILMFYISRARHNLNSDRRRVLEHAKVALRAEFDRPAQNAVRVRH